MSLLSDRAVEIVEADLERPEHQEAVLDLVNAYSMDPMGSGKPLSVEVQNTLIAGLREHPTTIIFLAYDDVEAVGIAVCFRGFSTFNARPLINIHDLAVLPAHRGRGVGRRLLEEVERKAREIGCCAITLEVGSDNRVAKDLYEAVGFSQTMCADVAGSALFLAKRLK